MLSQQIINGLMLGGIYVLVAVAFTLAIGVLNFLNFSIPGLFMLGGMLSWGLLRLGLPLPLAVLLALIAAALVSLIVQNLAYDRTPGDEPELPLVSSLGFLVLMENLIVIAWGTDQQSFPSLIPDFNWRPGGLVIGGGQLSGFIVALGLATWLSWFLRNTNAGRKLRAIAENRETADILGVDIKRLVPMVFVFVGVFTALGGVVFATTYLQVSAFMGEGVGFKGVAAMVLGGMGSIKGAILGGVLIGLTEILSIYLLGADYVDMMVYGLLLLFLVLRPQGIFGRPVGREKL